MQKLKTYIFFQVFNGTNKLYIIIDLKSQILSINCIHFEIIVCILEHLILVYYFLRSYMHKITLNIFSSSINSYKNIIVIYSKIEEIFNYNTI